MNPAAAQDRRDRPLLAALALARPLWPRLALAALTGAGAFGAAIALIATSGWLLSRAAQHPPVLTLMVAIVAVRAFGIARGCLRYVERLLAHDAAFRVMATTRVLVFTALERITPSGLGSYRSAELLSRLVDDVESLQDLYLRVALPAVAGGVVALGTSAGIGLVAPGAGFALLGGLVVAGVVLPWWAARAGANAEIGIGLVRGELSIAVLDGIDGAPDLLACGAVGQQLAAIGRLEARLARASRAAAAVAGVSTGLTALVTGLTTLSCLVLGISAVRSGQVPGVLLATVVLTPLAAFEAVAALPSAAQLIAGLRGSARRVLEVIGRASLEPARGPAAIDRPTSERPARDGWSTAPSPPVHLRLESVDARWAGASHPTLRAISLDLPAGRRIAVVGPSGAGKSTLAALLVAFLPPESGRLLVNGVDIRSIDGDDVRQVVGLCGQDAHVFDASIGDNVRIGRVDADEGSIRSALRRARLLDWVDALPQGLDTPVGEHGRQLSGGQRQRIALARALLADRPVIVLDEPTEHVEEACADELTADLLQAIATRTTVLITHRLTQLEDLDEIVVLVGGRIVQRGPQAELLRRAGWFRTAYTGQERPDRQAQGPDRGPLDPRPGVVPVGQLATLAWD